MLQFIVLGHEVGEHFRELFDLRGQFELLDQAISVLFELLWFELLIGK